jgi:hypothetical protein
MSSAVSSLVDHWGEMVTVALLGTDRREPPPPLPGGLADLAADHPRPTPSQRLLQQVAACTVVRRAGLLPAPPVALVAAPEADPRSLTPPSATTVAADDRRLAGLEDEWLLAVVAAGRRQRPAGPPVLARHRTDAVRHERALLAAGPLGPWMIGWSPRLACTGKRPAGIEHAVAVLPELAILPELQPLLTAPAAEVAAALRGGLEAARFGAGHRAVLVNLVARVAPGSLPAVVSALGRVEPSAASIGLAYALTDLAALRRHMLTELEPS